MAVVWLHNQLKRSKIEEQILDYVNQLCDQLPSPNGESAVEYSSLSSMPNVSSFTIGDKDLGIYWFVASSVFLLYMMQFCKILRYAQSCVYDLYVTYFLVSVVEF